MEEFQKEQIASQWASIPPEKLLQESFVEQLDTLQSLDQLGLGQNSLPGAQQVRVAVKHTNRISEFPEHLS